jgi:signal transduction histidine kinase/CheY-like chemotaxis protein
MWPAAGVALAAVWLHGFRLLPGVAAGVLLVVWPRAPWSAALLATIGVVTGIVLEVAILRRLRFDPRLERVRDPGILGLIAAPVGAAVTAAFLVLAGLNAAVISASSPLATWVLWWTRGWLGVVIAAPAIFAWMVARPIEWTWRRRLEAAALLIVIVAMGRLLVTLWALPPQQNVPLAFLFFPIVGWAGLRFGVRGASTVVLLIAAAALAAAALGVGPLGNFSRAQTLVVLFLFLMFASLSGLLLAAVMAERDEALSRRLALEEQLRHSQKMEAVGRLAGGIAHDFNNLLTAIIGYNEIVLAQLDAKDARRHDAEEIGRAAMRAADLTKQMLAFSRRQVLQPKVIDLHTVLGRVEPMLRRLIGEDISLVMATRATNALVCVDPGQIEQVIMNLAVNARDAMPDGGRLVVETGDVEVDADTTKPHPDATPGRYVMISVSDTGLGMTAEVKARIFEPYFTTKEAGKGTGLGLSTAYGIVRQSEGYITVFSEPGQGTTFRVYLPHRDAPALDADEVAASIPPGGHEHVLLVEDDPSVRRLTRQVLTRLGYSVTEAASGRSGLALGSDDTRHFDLVLADVVLGDMSGPAVAEALRALRPSIHVLYMSGYADDAIAETGALEDARWFLQKPFTPMDLARKIREVLEPQTEASHT